MGATRTAGTGSGLASGIRALPGMVQWGRSPGRAGQRGAMAGTAEGGTGQQPPWRCGRECYGGVKFTGRIERVWFCDGTGISLFPYVWMKEAVASGQ
jgi:hypothetical protein